MQTNSSKSISSFLEGRKEHVHLAGVCGVGMAGLAFLLRARGHKVSGCDLSMGRMAEWLTRRGIKVSAGHGVAHISESVKWVIRSAAVPADSSEMLYAAKRGVPVFSRGEVLPELIKAFTSVAVGGTHGKTTTTTFITRLLVSAGRSPSWCIGGEANELGGVAGFRGFALSDHVPPVEREIIAVEADESDGTLALYCPDIAVVTNIEFDHMEHFESVEAFENCFGTFIRNARRSAVYCLEDPRAEVLCRGVAKCLSYGFRTDADVRGLNLKPCGDGTRFTVVRHGNELGSIDLPVPGLHNVLNALAATAACLEMGLTFAEIQHGFLLISLPLRRFERVVDRRGVSVISDYAHHPSEVRALVRTAQTLKPSRLAAVFQPHRYTRTQALGADFPAAFEGVDELVLVPVYAASEKPLKGGTIWDLYEHFRNSAANGVPKRRGRPMKVSVARSLEQAWGYFKTTLKKGDLFLVVGAGDVEKIAGWAKNEVAGGEQGAAVPDLESQIKKLALQGSRVRVNEPLGRKTTLNVGGAADVFVVTSLLEDAAKVVKWARMNHVPCRTIGAGSNLLVSDLGVRGVTVRLAGGIFDDIRQENELVIAGGGVPLSRLLGWCEKRGLGGLEFLEGIPGTVGGAMRMNAGAWNDEIGHHAAWLRCLYFSGYVEKILSKSVEFRYRECSYLRERILVEAGLMTLTAKPGDIAKRRAQFREKRAWMNGFRSAGSVFKNPKDDFAGRLIERAGLKGAKIGGATVLPVHANVMATEGGATASDVMALIEKVRSEVLLKSKIGLETEVVFLE